MLLYGRLAESILSSVWAGARRLEAPAVKSLPTCAYASKKTECHLISFPTTLISTPCGFGDPVQA